MLKNREGMGTSHGLQGFPFGYLQDQGKGPEDFKGDALQCLSQFSPESQGRLARLSYAEVVLLNAEVESSYSSRPLQA